jgi:hypothetical protein
MLRGFCIPLTVTKTVADYVLKSERIGFSEKGLFMFIRRLGQKGRQQCESGYYCPQILEMADGDFAAVGPDITEEAVGSLPPGPGVGPKERIVRIPRRVMIEARPEIPTVA